MIYDDIQVKKVARKLCLRKREYSLTLSEQVKARKYRKSVEYLLANMNDPTADSVRCSALAKLCIQRYYKLMLMPKFRLPRPKRIRSFIDEFDSNECKNFFEFRQQDLHRLFGQLRFPDKCVLDGNSAMSGEEVFLRGLYELVSGEDQHNISANVFGREQTAQSQAFKYFINHLYNTFRDLLQDNLKFWEDNGFIDESHMAINMKLVELGCVPTDDFFGFIDCNCLETDRVGGGPRQDGPDADRWVCNVQRAFYNGWKSTHGLKHQSVVIAHGFTIDLFGPTSVRKNDLKLLANSHINARVAALYRGLCLYGDSIYPRLSNLRSAWRQRNLTPQHKAENKAMKSVRISIEWSYGAVSNMFHYLRNLDKLRLLRSEHLKRVYTVCHFLRNCHIALYGGIESNYFNLIMPHNMLEMYLQT
jgi:hypothetical protein